MRIPLFDDIYEFANKEIYLSKKERGDFKRGMRIFKKIAYTDFYREDPFLAYQVVNCGWIVVFSKLLAQQMECENFWSHYYTDYGSLITRFVRRNSRSLWSRYWFGPTKKEEPKFFIINRISEVKRLLGEINNGLYYWKPLDLNEKEAIKKFDKTKKIIHILVNFLSKVDNKGCIDDLKYETFEDVVNNIKIYIRERIFR